MVALITGGTGFIGAEVAHVLLERGESDVAVFSRSSSTQRLYDVADQIEFIQGDVGYFNHVLHAVKNVKPNVIYHCGAMVSVPSEADPAASIQTNAMGTFHVLEAARLFDVSKVLFASSIATFGLDIQEKHITDHTLQRPSLVYGATKLFGEHLGLFSRRKYEIDFRGIRFPSVVGPGVKTPAVSQYTSWMIEESVRGNPFTAWVKPGTKLPIVYYKDAARAIVELAEAPKEKIQTVNYLLDGVTPTPSAGELADAVRSKIPGARIDFQPDWELQKILDKALHPLDDRSARREWNWAPSYDLERMLEHFISELK
jgi:threonine 3-dehydrogenase